MIRRRGWTFGGGNKGGGCSGEDDITSSTCKTPDDDDHHPTTIRKKELLSTLSSLTTTALTNNIIILPSNKNNPHHPHPSPNCTESIPPMLLNRNNNNNSSRNLCSNNNSNSTNNSCSCSSNNESPPSIDVATTTTTITATKSLSSLSYFFNLRNYYYRRRRRHQHRYRCCSSWIVVYFIRIVTMVITIISISIIFLSITTYPRIFNDWRTTNISMIDHYMVGSYNNNLLNEYYYSSSILFLSSSLSSYYESNTTAATTTTNAAGATTTITTETEQNNKNKNDNDNYCTNIQKYNGLFHISMGDIGGGVGTSLIQLILVQLQYAEQYNLVPFVHFSNQYSINHSQVIYDPIIHTQQHLTTKITIPISNLVTNISRYKVILPIEEALSINTMTYRRYRDLRAWYPGPPPPIGFDTTTTTQSIDFTASNNQYHLSSINNYTLTESGIWEYYFLPVSDDYHPRQHNLNLCPPTFVLPVVTFPTIKYVIPGLHGYDVINGIRVWRYDYLPESISKYHLSYTTWVQPQRHRAFRIVQKYLHFQPYLIHAANEILYYDSNSSSSPINSDKQQQHPQQRDGQFYEEIKKTTISLGLHIRHSDKAAGRMVIPVQDYIPYVDSFIKAIQDTTMEDVKKLTLSKSRTIIVVYVATDSSMVVDEILTTWPMEQWEQQLLPDYEFYIRYSPNMIRSNTSTAVFDLVTEDVSADTRSTTAKASTSSSSRSMVSSSSSSLSDVNELDLSLSTVNGHHRTNQEVLIDIISLSNCTYLIHTHSAVSESAIWIAGPQLYETNSINLEDPDHISANEFYIIVQSTVPGIIGTSSNTTTDNATSITKLPKPIRGNDQWPYYDTDEQPIIVNTTKILPCSGFNQEDGSPSSSSISASNPILHIHSFGSEPVTASRAFFTNVLNQLLYAERHILQPWIHISIPNISLFEPKPIVSSQSAPTLDNNNNSSVPSSYIVYDPDVATTFSNNNQTTTKFVPSFVIENHSTRFLLNDDDPSKLHQNQPHFDSAHISSLQKKKYTVVGNGIWNLYFEPVVPSSIRCSQQHQLDREEQSAISTIVVRIDNETLLSPGLDSYCTWCIRSWRYDTVPEALWFTSTQPTLNTVHDNHKQSLKEFLEPMRIKANSLVHKYYKFQPYILQRANEVNPSMSDDPTTGNMNNNDDNTEDSVNNVPCLGIHIRLSDKNGKYRKKVRAKEYLPYIEAFFRVGGRRIYLATDSRKAYQYLQKQLPSSVFAIIRSQGQYVVRAIREDVPLYTLEDHHRVNAEVFVDIVALSKCQYFIHTFSTTAEAAIYRNLALHNNSINLEDTDIKPTIPQFEKIMQERFSLHSTDIIMLDKDASKIRDSMNSASNSMKVVEPRILPESSMTVTENPDTRFCRTNAIVYLAQKQHSTYNRDSYGSLLKSLALLHKNYLSIGNHLNTTDIFIFHTGDFNATDLTILETHVTGSDTSTGHVRLVDISNTSFWARPKANANDSPSSWYAWPLFSEGYRRMMHWFAIDLWDFFTWYNANQVIVPSLSSLLTGMIPNATKCHYRYIMRFDEDSFLHSPIEYDIFDFMEQNKLVYGYRMCAYELKVTHRMIKAWMQLHPSFVPERPVNAELCGFYNNFFIADLKFFTSERVQTFLQFINRKGHIYRRRLGDLMIHSMAVYWFAPQAAIHRFLDFTYEHGTITTKDHQGKSNNNIQEGCLLWGGIQAGYADRHSDITLRTYYNEVTQNGCSANRTYLSASDLSPSFQHPLPIPIAQDVMITLQTITAGAVELPNQGINSG